MKWKLILKAKPKTDLMKAPGMTLFTTIISHIVYLKHLSFQYLIKPQIFKTKFDKSAGLSDIILNVEIKTSITFVALFKHFFKV